MTNEENIQLLLEYKTTGNLNARNEIINQNLGLLQTILDDMGMAHKFDDVQSFAVEEMIKAINAFDTSRKVKLSTFLYRYIKTGVHLYLREQEKIKCQDITSFDDSHGVDEESCLDGLINEETLGTLNNSLDGLLDRERDIITAYYGIGRKKETQVAIAKRLDCTIHQVYKTRKEVILKLQENFS